MALTARNDPRAIGQLREGLRQDPDSSLYANNLAWILATHPDANIRNGTEAVALAEQATRRELAPGKPRLAPF